MKSLRCRYLGCLAGALCMLLMASQARAEGDGEKPGGGPRGPAGGFGQILTVEKIEERLGEKLSDELKTKVNAARDEIIKKKTELEAKDEVKAARVALEGAKEPDEKKAAQAKLKEALGGFNAYEEYKTALGKILTEEQVGKIFARGGGRKSGAGRREEKKPEEKKEEPKKTEEAPKAME